MLAKANAEVAASRIASAKDAKTIDTLTGMSATQMAMIAARDKELADAQKRYDRLALVKCDVTSILWGLIKKKTCF